ncbi:hypothetical protein QE394_001122 [Arthrobacter sp. SORGH_AS 212]|nr:hypothetical protein [Arthrobacter sp. SORGH_AS_0212]
MRVCKFCTGLNGNHLSSCTRFDYHAPLPPLTSHSNTREWETEPKDKP